MTAAKNVWNLLFAFFFLGLCGDMMMQNEITKWTVFCGFCAGSAWTRLMVQVEDKTWDDLKRWIGKFKE